MIQRVREHPLFYTEHHGGYWVVTSHALSKQVLKDHETFSSQKHDDGTAGVTIPTMMGPRLLPAEADAPYHRALRKVLTPRFNKSAVDQMRPSVEAFIEATIDRVIEKRDFDIVHDIADVIPAGVMVERLGFPESERVPFIKSVQAAMTAIPLATQSGGEMTPEIQEGMAGFLRAVETIKAVIEERRAHPTEDIISHMAQPEHGLSDDELLWLTFTLIAGGAENPAALITNALKMLADDPDLRMRLIADPTQIPAATEEFLRTVTPGVSLVRNVKVDTVLEGQQLLAGERILMWLPAANHDPQIFEAPERFDIDRGSCPHLALGDGPHFCVGAMLARLQFNVLLSQVLTRMPDFTIDLERSERFDDASTMWGWRTMPATTNLPS